MDNSLIEQSFYSKRSYFDNGFTHSYEFRLEKLKKLKKAIHKYEHEILAALHEDLHKPEFEAYTSEIGVMYEEINYAVRHLKKWMEASKVKTPFFLMPSTSRILNEPLGVVLIIGPWNYPFQLLFAPLVGAIAAGNTVILKPSDKTKHTSAVIEKLITETFDNNYISVVRGSGAIIGPLLIEKYRFDHIFFTGSASVGKQIMSMAANHLTPVTLELGGKSPAIVDIHCNLATSARSIVWAKYFNSGQTCVAPDYLLIHEDVKDDFIKEMIKNIIQFYGPSPEKSPHLTHIINNRRFEVLVGYLKSGNIIHGGQFKKDLLFIEPTMIDGVGFDDQIMKEEIFGPILPILTYRNPTEIIDIVRKNRYPLACYIFSSDKKFQDYIIEKIEFGGGSINNALVHLANPALPFGGIGNSGMGNYHGKKSFDALSHTKSILSTSTCIDIKLRYPPYNKSKMNWARWLFK